MSKTHQVSSIEVHLSEYAMKEVAWFGKRIGGERIVKNLQGWERVYGPEVAGRIRERVRALWRKKFPDDRPRKRSSTGGLGGDGAGREPSEAQPAAEIHSGRDR